MLLAALSGTSPNSCAWPALSGPPVLDCGEPLRWCKVIATKFHETRHVLGLNWSYPPGRHVRQGSRGQTRRYGDSFSHVGHFKHHWWCLMPGYPAWVASPRARRSLSQASNALTANDNGQSRLALLVGAGVDQSLSSRPSWTELLERLGRGFDGGPKDEGLATCAADWPTEAAEALRLTMGPKSFASALRDALPARPDHIAAASPLASAITGLVQRSLSVIVSLNYTDDLVLALQANLPDSITVRTIDNVEMSAWPVGRIFAPPTGVVHVLRLHGSLQITDSSVVPEIVLGRTSYDVMLAGDSPYKAILNRLFEDFAVLSIGVSWGDVPLRDAAAQARRRFPVARLTHYAARQHSGDGRRDWWEERALASSYGLQPLYYLGHDENASIVEAILRLTDSAAGPAAGSDLAQVADWLDSVGDYESPQQSFWFAVHWVEVVKRIEDACQLSVLTPAHWLAMAGIERHLRHFIWNWLSQDERVEVRQDVWTTIAEAYARIADGDGDHTWRNERLVEAYEGNLVTSGERHAARILFEFAIGAYEIFGQEAVNNVVAGSWVARLEHLRGSSSGSVVSMRANIASRMWTPEVSADLLILTRKASWEGMEAKLVLDLAEKRFRAQIEDNPLEAPRDLSARVRDMLWMELDHAREISRVSGFSRREISATVLASFLAPTVRAEADLIASYRRLREFGGEQMESGSAWSVVFGLIAVFVDQARDFSDQELIEPICSFVEGKCGHVPLNAAILSAVEGNYSKYWRPFHRRAANLAPRVAAHMLAGRA